MPKLQILLNTRERTILYVILNSNGSVTIREIAEKTGLSARIVRYNMPNILRYLENEGVTAEVRPGHGYDFALTRTAAKRISDALDADSALTISWTREQRLHTELMDLLTADNPVSFQSLAENEGISRSTIVMDTVRIEEWLNRFNLKLIKMPNRGTFVMGNELFRRCAMIELIRKEIGMARYYDIWMNHPDCLDVDRTTPRPIASFIATLDLKKIYPYIDFVEKGMGLRLALYSRIEIALYLAIAVETMRKNTRSQWFERTLYSVEPGSETRVAEALMNRIERDLGVSADDFERNIMAVMLLFSKWDNEDISLSSKEEYSGEQVFNISQDALQCADMITGACSIHIHPLLQTDEELVMNLARHFHTVFYQIQYGYPIINENLDLILQDYPEIFRSVNSEISLIEDQIHHKIPPEEIGYIVMYMVSALNRLQTEKHFRIPVVIIGDGIRSRTIFLKDRLQLFFPTMEVIAVINGFPEDKGILEKAALILSLIPGIPTDRPVIEVSAFLTQNEIRVIQNWIIEYEEKTRETLLMPARKPDLIDLLRPEHIILNARASGWEDVIRLASKPLEEQKLIRPSFCDAMIRLTEEYGPYTTLAPGVVLLNARPNDGVNKLCMSMLILEHPVDFGVTLNISTAFVLGASDNHSHLNALYQLSKVCEKAEFIESLKRCRRVSDVLRAIWLYSSDISLEQLI